MKFSRLVGSCFLLLCLSSEASSTYIVVTKTKNKNHLNDIYNKIHRLNLKMTYKKKSDYYIVYSGPYQTQRTQSYALAKLQRYFPNAKEIRKKSKSDKTLNSQTQKSNLKLANKDNSGFYLGASAGYSSALMSHTIKSGLVIIQEPKSEGITYSLNMGYDFSNGICLGASYALTDTDDLKFKNAYGELNYKFYNSTDFTPYMGVTVGFSQLSWVTDPIKNSAVDSNPNSSSLLYGTLMGAEYELISSFYIYLNYNSMFVKHVTNIEDATNNSTIKNNFIHTLQSGFKYKF